MPDEREIRNRLTLALAELDDAQNALLAARALLTTLFNEEEDENDASS